MTYTVYTSPKDFARHAYEYEILKQWFSRRIYELGLDELDSGDALDPFHPYNQAFDALCKEAEKLWKSERNYVLSPLQLTHAFFQMKNPVQPDNLEA